MHNGIRMLEFAVKLMFVAILIHKYIYEQMYVRSVAVAEAAGYSFRKKLNINISRQQR